MVYVWLEVLLPPGAVKLPGGWLCVLKLIDLEDFEVLSFSDAGL